MKVIIKGLKLVKGPVEFYPSMPQKWYVVESGEKLDAVLENGQRFTLQQVPLKHKPRVEGEARYEGGQAILSSGVYQGPEFRVQGYFMDGALVIVGDNILLNEGQGRPQESDKKLAVDSPCLLSKRVDPPASRQLPWSEVDIAAYGIEAVRHHAQMCMELRLNFQDALSKVGLLDPRRVTEVKVALQKIGIINRDGAAVISFILAQQVLGASIKEMVEARIYN